MKLTRLFIRAAACLLPLSLALMCIVTPVVLPRETSILPGEEMALAEVAEKIVRGDYTQIAEKAPSFSDDLAGICQDKLPHLPRHEHWSRS